MNIFNGPITITIQAPAAAARAHISMSNTEFIRGYRAGLVEHLASDPPSSYSDDELLEMLKAQMKEEDSSDNDLHYFLGFVIGIAQAQR